MIPPLSPYLPHQTLIPTLTTKKIYHHLGCHWRFWRCPKMHFKWWRITHRNNMFVQTKWVIPGGHQVHWCEIISGDNSWGGGLVHVGINLGMPPPPLLGKCWPEVGWGGVGWEERVIYNNALNLNQKKMQGNVWLWGACTTWWNWHIRPGASVCWRASVVSEEGAAMVRKMATVDLQIRNRKVLYFYSSLLICRSSSCVHEQNTRKFLFVCCLTFRSTILLPASS